MIPSSLGQLTNSNFKLISPTHLIDRLMNGEITSVIDVRSEGEFTEGRIPGSVNAPILNDQERHLVGLEYKLKGQESAIQLGLKLVEPHISQRIGQWFNVIKSNQNVALTCWRGGLRSKIAAKWILDHGREVFRVEGGYKAVRHQLLNKIESPHRLVVVGGWTGSGKTELIRSIDVPKVDLEGLANHRGSCFGEILGADGRIVRQSSQATFENEIAYRMWRDLVYVVEDESTRIGSLNVPMKLKEQMKAAPVVVVDEPPERRALHIYTEYINVPSQQGVSTDVIQNFFTDRLKFIQRHLGGAKYNDIYTQILKAFSTDINFNTHQGWITALLVDHYDRAYQYSFDRLDRKILFRGCKSECANYLKDQFGHQSEMI